MSETMHNAEEKREPYVAELDQPLAFNYDAEAQILTSMRLGQSINAFFKEVFADYEGCKIEVSQRNELSLSLVFRHEANRDENKHYGVELSAAKKTHNSTLDRSRGKDYALLHGDRYTLTEDGMDIITPLVRPNYKTQNGKINWGQIIADFSEGNTMYTWKTEQFTKVSGLDLNFVCSLLFGKKDQDGNNVVYMVDYRGVAGVPGFSIGGAAQNFVLWINRINVDKLQQTYADLGLGSTSSIIR